MFDVMCWINWLLSALNARKIVADYIIRAVSYTCTAYNVVRKNVNFFIFQITP